jgi:AbrB family looped-hinge helix DNA binding protein
MSNVQVHYDGWVTLPVAAREQLGLTTGDRLEVELTGDAIVLRRARPSVATEPAATEPVPRAEPRIVEAEAEETASAAAPEPAVKRGPGRPRKAPVAALPPNLKTRGRRKAVSAAEALPV